MWKVPNSPAFWFTLASGLSLLAIVALSQAGAFNAPSSPGECLEKLVPHLATASCSAPTGSIGFTVHLCVDSVGVDYLWIGGCISTDSSFGVVNVYAPDLNPADYVAFVLCEIAADATSIWNSIIGYVEGLIASITNSITTDAANFVVSIFSTVAGAVDAVIGWFGQIVNSISNAVTSVAQTTGPLAPLVAAALFAVMLLLGTIGLYFAVIGMIALSKSVYNAL